MPELGAAVTHHNLFRHIQRLQLIPFKGIRLNLLRIGGVIQQIHDCRSHVFGCTETGIEGGCILNFFYQFSGNRLAGFVMDQVVIDDFISGEPALKQL